MPQVQQGVHGLLAFSAHYEVRMGQGFIRKKGHMRSAQDHRYAQRAAFVRQGVSVFDRGCDRGYADHVGSAMLGHPRLQIEALAALDEHPGPPGGPEVHQPGQDEAAQAGQSEGGEDVKLSRGRFDEEGELFHCNWISYRP